VFNGVATIINKSIQAYAVSHNTTFPCHLAG